ncbi:hypothetical protein AM500_18185 [Bacillus sp. FJAT-18017]|uniref:SIS domain-containing protein n=1 Tax=Bacillus sp. FJAT-18017 TaxID=1705566 RepID=UPI0006AE19CF|nr:SIS domain-containing protein [Bacillus sp. FJAT-18017]ALC91498.1 hypothetical protein AM500_18185 [Bacillus sp. FJAT-18017]
MSNYTWKEITSQGEALQKTYELMEKFALPVMKYNEIHVFTGCGTSFYLAHSAAKYFQKVTGKTAVAVPASEIFMDPDTVFSKDSFYRLVAISRSGTTSEVVKALKHVNGSENIKTLAVTCNKGSEITAFTEAAIELDFINEKSVVMTQSFSNMLYSLQLYAALVSGSKAKMSVLESVPALAGSVLADKDQLRPLAENDKFKRFIFLGAGVFNGLAKEATLKLKEMTQIECESYSNLEFRHGPISIVDNVTVAVLLSSDSTLEYDESLIADIQGKGGTVVVFSKEGCGLTGDINIPIPSLEPSDDLAAAFMPQLQLLAYYKALALGLDPDKPRNLTQVVQIQL